MELGPNYRNLKTGLGRGGKTGFPKVPYRPLLVLDTAEQVCGLLFGSVLEMLNLLLESNSSRCKKCSAKLYLENAWGRRGCCENKNSFHEVS